jgi:translation elongation factor EF-Ts
VRVRFENGYVVGIQLACETDFVAKNEQFVKAADKILEVLLNEVEGEVDSFDKLPDFIKQKINDIVNETIAVV